MSVCQELPSEPRTALSVEVYIDGMSLNSILSFHNLGSLEHSVSVPKVRACIFTRLCCFPVCQGDVTVKVFVPQALSVTSPAPPDEWDLDTKVVSSESQFWDMTTQLTESRCHEVYGVSRGSWRRWNQFLDPFFTQTCPRKESSFWLGSGTCGPPIR